VEWIAARVGIDPPRAASRRDAPSRRFRSARTREALGIALAFPSFRDGLEPLLPAAH
jgi:hypothetical protein